VLCTSSQTETCRAENCEDKEYGCHSHKQCRKVGREHDGLRLIANVQRRLKVAGRRLAYKAIIVRGDRSLFAKVKTCPETRRGGMMARRYDIDAA
jgi:hypothetical protein